MGDTRKIMQQYLDALSARAAYGQYFADDIVVTVEGSDQRAEGREAGEQLIRFMHEVAFDAHAEVKTLLVDEDKAAIEADFVGTHAGEFAGVAPTGRAVRVPYSVMYELRGDQISNLRIYLPLSVLIEQITG
jgi:predicted ester cyclase